MAALFLILAARLLAGVNPCYRGTAASSTTSVDANYRGVLAFLDISAHTGRPSLVNFDDQLRSISALDNMPPSAPAPHKLWPTALRRLSSIVTSWTGSESANDVDFSPVQNVTVDNNLLNGGGYSLYGASGDGKAYSGQTVNIKVTNNHFGAKFYPQCGQYGPVTYFSPSASGNLWSGNVWDRTGAPLIP